ncbi:hypothetical protein X798_06160 [Onchocerca flexuosa]|uniref:Uncharacterized protein n=1 Tax=Onchocerca flexuosa TaxID=387005 RepID=A0A238BQA1_9BILA|nr:hypothetical protein X798_06160 [Onchocerca flexuosa]
MNQKSSAENDDGSRTVKFHVDQIMKMTNNNTEECDQDDEVKVESPRSRDVLVGIRLSSVKSLVSCKKIKNS